MDEQSQGSPDKLISILQALRDGHGLLSAEQFLKLITDGQHDVLRVAQDCYVLIKWTEIEEGPALEIVTATGSAQLAPEGLAALESYAKRRGAVAIIGVARAGWKPIVEMCGYETTRTIFMRKYL